MEHAYNIDEKIYPAADGGAMRVSDLHIKIGTQPAYRIDGELVRLKGGVVTPEVAEKLIYPLLGNKNIEHLKRDMAVDCSYKYGSLQFRINAFIDNEGLVAAVRALGTDIPVPECLAGYCPPQAWVGTLYRNHRGG
jgi:twitching motility protein PilT